MAHIMDGSTGTAHISSKDWATFNAATYGLESGVFDWGDRFKLTMGSANKGTVGTGAALVAGRRVWIEAPESVTVANGGQGVKRNDIVGLQYEAYSDDAKTREKATLKVVKGTPASSSPADPELPANFLPLWRVPLDGLNVGDTVALAPRVPSAAGLRDEALGEQSSRLGGVDFVRRGPVVYATGGYSENIGSDPWSSKTLGTLPEGMRPAAQATLPVTCQLTGAPCVLEVQVNGDVRFRLLGGGSGHNGYVFVSGCYLAGA